MFLDKTKGKALLILDKNVKEHKQIPIYMLPSTKNKTAVLNTISDILNQIKPE